MYDLSVLPERFRSKFRVSTEHFYNGTPCWEWIAGRSQGGYGQYRHQGKKVYAHRLAYHFLVDPKFPIHVPHHRTIRGTITLDHLCRNRRCVNPDHLEPTSLATNILRGTGSAAQLAGRTHCKWGHQFTPENTYFRHGTTRGCRKCRREKSRQFYRDHPERWQNYFRENRERIMAQRRHAQAG